VIYPKARQGDDQKLSAKAETTTHEKLERLLAGDLEFHSESSRYSSHALHAFAAKFPPQLPRVFIEELTQPGDVVLDPMMGSGTTIVEALLRERKGIGVDIDPLARMICRVKTSHIASGKALTAGADVLARAEKVSDAKVAKFLNSFDETSHEFIDYWFFRETQEQLSRLLIAINDEQNEKVKEFLLLVLSSVIITKSGGVSLARDLAHSRPHKDKTKQPKHAFDQFKRALGKAVTAVSGLIIHEEGIQLLEGDARDLPVESSSVDLIVTSPPYANALDYMRAHKFSLVWLGESIKWLGEHRSRYIGSERIDVDLSGELPVYTEGVLTQLGALDQKKQKVVRKYFLEMRQAMREMFRVLKPDSASIIVVATSTMRGYVIPTQECLADLGRGLGFDVVGIAERKLDRNRRMLPTRFKKNDDSMIEQRMNEEYIIALLKPEAVDADTRTDLR
jgi:DNA modification methylase